MGSLVRTRLDLKPQCAPPGTAKCTRTTHYAVLTALKLASDIQHDKLGKVGTSRHGINIRSAGKCHRVSRVTSGRAMIQFETFSQHRYERSPQTSLCFEARRIASPEEAMGADVVRSSPSTLGLSGESWA